MSTCDTCRRLIWAPRGRRWKATASIRGDFPGCAPRSRPIHSIVYFAPGPVEAARITSAGQALRCHLDGPAVASLPELSDLLWAAVRACRFDGRPLAAAWSQLPRPDDAVESAWLAATILREHRGDGHVLAGVGAGLRGLDATVSFVATGAVRTGGTLCRDIEDLTDRLASAPVERLGDTGVSRAIDLATPVSRHLIDTGVIPVPNAVGAPRP